MLETRNVFFAALMVILSGQGMAITYVSQMDGRPLGLADISALYGCILEHDQCKPVKVELRTKPDNMTKPQRFAAHFSDLRHIQYRMGAGGAFVYERKGEEWFLVRLATDTGERFWVHKKDVAKYLPFEKLFMEYPLMVLDQWDGALRDKPDRNSPVSRRLWDQIVLGYVTVAEPKKPIKVKLKGKEGANNERQVPMVPGNEFSRVEFMVKKSPDDNSETLFSFHNDMELMFVHTVSGAGGGSCQNKAECDAYFEQSRQLLVFDRKGEWIRIKGAHHAPQNGAFGWIKVSPVLSPIKPLDDSAVRKAVINRVYGGTFGYTFLDDRIATKALKMKWQGQELWAYLDFDGNQCTAKTKWKKAVGWVPIYTDKGDLQIFFNLFCDG